MRMSENQPNLQKLVLYFHHAGLGLDSGLRA